MDAWFEEERVPVFVNKKEPIRYIFLKKNEISIPKFYCCVTALFSCILSIRV